MRLKMKELGITFMVPFVITLIVLVSAAFYIVYIQDEEKLRADLKEQARHSVNSVLAVRKIFAENQDKINSDSKGNFEFKHLNPATAANFFIVDSNKLTVEKVKQVSDRYRKAEDAPDAWESAVLENFRANKELKEVEELNRSDHTYRYAIPLYIENDCLDCHGEPKGERDITGNLKEGYKLGELRGIVSVNISLADYYALRNERILLLVILVLGLIIASAVAGFKMVKSLGTAANTDKLTKLNNRNLLSARLTRELKLSQNNKNPLSLIMFDIDHFKKVNDTYGHLAGDMVLKEIAELTQKSARGRDFLFRFGGEEFLIIAPNTDEKGSYALAERLRLEVSRHSFNIGNERIKITISLGIATSRVLSGAETVEEKLLLNQADQALYQAKNNGRNRVEKYSDENDTPT